MAARPAARAVGGVLLGGAFLYTLADATNDAVTYRVLKRLAMQQAGEHQGLQQQLGAPLTPGPWYNASVAFTHGGHIAYVTFPLHGEAASSEVVVRAVRRTYPLGTLAYNTAGPGEWKLLVLDALVPAGGGLPRPMSLLGPEPGAAAGGAGGGGDGGKAIKLEGVKGV